ncbi:hypothetical protein [Gimesia aquarii]|uniref:Uncharacterized protein n=1 Tax=Gimesia aquarii TaxID=2527964 RepID=A0A517WPX7_9PLAN|nr:hypothetical protein [Gimesia aquarii]QDU07288.1 hypothetical protein V202x_06400 [Gimesia aquarii]
MKPVSMKQTEQTNKHLASIYQSRRGSTLLVVIALLAMLSLLGVVFFTFSSQEERSAQYFTEAALNEADPGLDADVLFNWGLQQLIVGPDESLHNSALHGKWHSLLPKMFGTDPHPFSGQGINVIYDGLGNLVVDQDYDGTADPNQDLLFLNHSVGAHGGTLPSGLQSGNLPEPDVDYTAPDINNLFLAYKGYTLYGGNLREVIIPSFLRPQFLRDGSGTHYPDWYSNANTAGMVLRPHPDHLFVDPSGNAPGDTRFTTSFPFQPLLNITGGNPTIHGELGIFTDSFDSVTNSPIIELDVDNDDDGIVDGIWMDLDFPPIQNPNDPTKYIIPLFSFTIYDLDALVNLNTAGNMRRPDDIDLNYAPGSRFFGEDSATFSDKYLFLSRSNMGLSSPGEINPQWVLNARPEISPTGDLDGSASAAAVFQQHRLFFGGFPYPHGLIAAPHTYGTAGVFQNAYESTRDWREISNMEYFFLNYGRAEFGAPANPGDNGTKNEIIDLYAGRWGEPNLLYDAQRNTPTENIFVVNTTGGTIVTFPRAGQTLVDDNANRYEGGVFSGSLNGSRANVNAFMHPLAYNGSGRVNKPGSSYRQAAISFNGWRGYEDIEVAGNVRYSDGLRLFKNSNKDRHPDYFILLDDADEMTVDLEKVQRPYDEPFAADDLAFLHLSQTDRDNTGVSSRLEDLLPFNFGRSGSVNARRDPIRQKFTTMSWDRKQFGIPVPRIPGFRDWEFASGQFPPFSFLPDNLDPFRPALNSFLTVIPNNTNSAIPRFQMKLNLNQLLVFDQTGTGKTVTTRPLTPHPGEDLNGNGTLDVGEDTNGNGVLDSGEDSNGNGLLDFGEDLNGNGVLDSLSSTVINTSWDGESNIDPMDGSLVYPNLPAYPPNTMEQQEFWARYDRQLMARDIYVLLYTLGGGSDSTDYSLDNSGNALYTNAQLEEMAQFAVNVVDALDPDDVITRFEYDTNLNNGWNLDDNPYTSAGETDRAEVFGVEAQKLTLSEFLAIKAPKVTDSGGTEVDHGATEYNDEEDRYFSYIELRNASPQTISFNNDAWQIRLEPRADSVDADHDDLDNLPADSEFSSNSFKRRLTLRNGSVGSGGIFSIRSAGDDENTDPMSGMPRESYFQVDPNYTGSGLPTLTRIVPLDISTPAIDLITDDDTTDFLLTRESDTVTPMSGRGDFLNDSNTASGSTNFNSLTFVVRLMRRAHLGRNTPAVNNAIDNADNPWVEVDSMVVTGMNEFTLTQATIGTQIQDQLNQLRSYERSQPLYARGSGNATHAAGNAGSSYRANTVGTTNSNTGIGSVGPDGANGISGFDDDNASGADNSAERGWAFSDDRPRFHVWQPHFDRDYASIVELFSVPIVGPNRITRDLATVAGKQGRAGSATDVLRENDVKFAGTQKFLDPNGPDASDTTDDNRWFRFLEFVEVPTRSHLQLGNPLNDPRVPGRINLNTIRNPSILAALLDDTDAFTMDMSGDPNHPSLNAPHLGGGDWWQAFIDSRDNIDPGLANPARIPGTPVRLDLPRVSRSQPFRSFYHSTPASSATDVQNLREHTIFRSLPTESGSANPRLLFELATNAEHVNAGSVAVDSHTRNRILSKIAANTTTRSNTFVVFMSVAYFEATGTGTTIYGDPVQIGARLSPFPTVPVRTANQPDYRGFFVIDRTRAEQAFEPTTGQFDNWKRLIRHRHTIQNE